MSGQHFDLSAWTTIEAAAHEHAIPVTILEHAILAGKIEARNICGSAIVRREDAALIAARLRSGGCCDGCA